MCARLVAYGRSTCWKAQELQFMSQFVWMISAKKNLQMVFPKALELGRPGAPPATAALAKADLTCVDWKLAEAADILVDFHSFPEFP